MLSASEQVQTHYQELARLASSESDPENFFGPLLKAILSLVPDVAAGAVWIAPGQATPLQLICQSRLNPAWTDPQNDEGQRHGALISRVITTGKSHIIAAGSADDAPGFQPFADHLLLIPAARDQRVLGVVELVVYSHANLQGYQQHLAVLSRFADLVGQWLATSSIRQVQRRGELLSHVNRFAKEIHASIDLRETCYAIANETRLFLKTDRVSVATAHANKCLLRALSGQATIDHRSRVVTTLTELVHAVVVSGEPLIYGSGTLDLPPQIEERLDEYLDESFVKGLLIMPLFAESSHQGESKFLSNGSGHASEKPTSIGAVVIEQFEGQQPIADVFKGCEPLLDHIRLAMSNAVSHHDIPLRPLWQGIARSRVFVSAKNLPKTLAVVGALALFALVLCIWPAELPIRAGGMLQPIERRDVFVDVPGTVKKVLVSHGDHVEVGELVADLKNTDLEVQLAEVVGQLQSAEKQALAAEKKMIDNQSLDAAEKHRLASDRLILNRRIESLKKQYRLLDAKRDLLQVRSPAPGSVISWDVAQRLMNKPLSKGEVLLSIADLSGPWELELFVPERRIGHVATALHKNSEPLEVEFILRTDPSTIYKGQVKEVRASAELQEAEGLGVRVKVHFNEKSIPNLYPGAVVAAEIHCGRYPLGYVWFHEVFEWLYTHLFF